MQLTAEQEHRIQALVASGAYRTTEEALDAAVSAAVLASMQSGLPPEELERLLLDGFATPEPSDEDFWDLVDGEPDALVADWRGSLSLS